jgi:cytoskeleton protein RodZ
MDEKQTLGEALRTARERKRVRIAQVATETRIPRDRLEALEANALEKFPDDVYIKGNIRNYAIYLGVDPDRAIELYRRARPEAAKVRPLQTVTTHRRITPAALYALVVVLLLIALLVGLLALHVLVL